MPKKIFILGVNPYSDLIQDVLISSHIDSERCSGNKNDFTQVILQYKKYLYEYEFFIGFEDNALRKEIDQKYKVNWHCSINCTCDYPSKRSRVDVGTFIMPKVIVHNENCIGRHCIIGIGSILDRNCVVGNYVNMDINVVLERGVTIGDSVHIGTRATVLEGVHIADGCNIAPGAIVSEDITKPGTQYGFSNRKLLKL